MTSRGKKELKENTSHLPGLFVTFPEGYFEVHFPFGDYFEDYFFQKKIAKLKIVTKIVSKEKTNLKTTL